MYGISERVIRKIVLEKMNDDLLFDKLKDEVEEYVTGDLIQYFVTPSELENYYTRQEIDTQHKDLTNQIKADIVDTAKEDFDTLKEIGDWIEEHQDVYKALVSELGVKVNNSDFILAISELKDKDKSILTDVTKISDEHKKDVNNLSTEIMNLGKELEKKIDTKQDKGDYPVYLPYQERKTIQLRNYDSISGVTTDGVGTNLVMLSKWNVADFGSTSVHLNLNGKNERPTYNDKKDIALMDDISALDSKIDANVDNLKKIIKSISDRIYDLENRKYSNVEGITI